MQNIKVSLKGKEAEGFVIPLGNVNLVFVKSKNGIVGCGAFDVMALEKFGYPAAKVKPRGDSVKDVDDLLAGTIVAVNPSGEKLGIKTGMSGKEAAEIMI